jgi:hypothetical protein
MPSAETILGTAAAIANDWRTLAIAWHVLLGTLLSALLIGWRPSNRVVGYLLAAPFLSVSALAWAAGNPFNGTVFALLAFCLAGLAIGLSIEAVQVAPPQLMVPGMLLVAFGWTYPHFLNAESWTAYVYAAPLGLLPCPTLSTAIGITLVFGALRSAPWSAVLAAAGIAYGAIGVFSLGVTLDYGLLAGATVLGAAVVMIATRAERTTASIVAEHETGR